MENINVGFIGGCINKQSGIKRQDLFYSVLKNELLNKLNVKISLGNYFSYELLPKDSLNLLDRKKPDILCLFIRPFPLIPLSKLLIKYIDIEGRKVVAIHPQLFVRQNKWDIKFTSEELGPYVSKKSFRFSLKDLNILIGFGLGLNKWANKYILNQIEKVNDICLNRNVKFVVISPPQYTSSIGKNLVCRRMTNSLKEYCNSKISYININNINNFEKDKIHFNEQGHKELGQMISRRITEIIKS